MAPSRYSEWLTHVFDHEVTDPQWFFDIYAPDFSASDREITELFTHTMQNCGQDLRRFSDAQVDQGLNYIFSNSCSNFVFSILDGDFAFELKLEAIRSIETLYTDCFASRCTPVLSHHNELVCSPLNHMCYMLWDVTPLNYWEGRTRKAEAYAAVVDVLEATLRSNNIACLEGALHGLGHTYSHVPERIGPLVERFVSENSRLPPELLSYARNAAVGYVP